MSHIKPDSSLVFVAMKVHGEFELEPVLEWMRDNGSSVLLNWGEDNDLWECSWITGGKRFTGTSQHIRPAILGSLNKAFARYGTPEAAMEQYGDQQQKAKS